MFCPKCGAQNADDARACTACGAEVIQPSQRYQPPLAPTMMGGAPRTSSMAILSLILGILGVKQVNDRPAEFTGPAAKATFFGTREGIGTYSGI